MGKEVHKFNGMSYSIVEGNPKSSDRNAKKHKKKTEKVLLKRTVKTDEDQEVNGGTPIEDNHKSKDGTEETAHAKKKKLLLKEASTIEEKHKVDIVSRPEKRRSKDEREERQKNKRRGLLNDSNKADEEQKGDGESIAEEVNPKSSYEITDNKIDKMENGESNRSREEQNVNPEGPPGEEKQEPKKKNLESRKNKKKQQLLEEAAKADQRGICYLSRIPPHMDPIKLRQILSQYGEIQRIYLAPEDPTNRVSQKRENRKRDGGQEQGFSEGWVEFTKKSVAKRVANMLNGEQIGGRKRSSFYYDLWNINYLSKFKWDDLTAEIAYKNAIREQKLALEISAAKRERDFYLSKVDQSHALNSIKERIKKKQKVQQESQTHSELPDSQQVTKVIRQFPQKQPVADKAADTKPRLSKDILAGVFGGC